MATVAGSSGASGERHGLALERLGRQLRDAPAGSPLRPGDDFRRGLREQLMIEGAAAQAMALIPAPRAVRAPVAVPARARLSRRARSLRIAVRVSVAGIAASTVVTGVAYASERALPGDALYGVKRAAEGVQLSLADGDTDRGLLHLEFASTRLHEVRELVAEAGPAAASGQRVLGTLHDMDVETNDGARLLTQAYLARPATAPLARLVDFTRAQESTLSAVLPVLPAPAGQTSLGVLRAVQIRTTQLLSAPTGAPTAPPVLPVSPSVEASPGAVDPSAQPTGSPTPVAPPTSLAVTTTPVAPAEPTTHPATSASASVEPSADPATSADTSTAPSTGPTSSAAVTTSPTPAPSSGPPTPTASVSTSTSPTDGASSSAGPTSPAPTTPAAPTNTPSGAVTTPPESPQPSTSTSVGPGPQGTGAGTGTDRVGALPTFHMQDLGPW